MKTVITVILYNKDIIDSTTLKTILNSQIPDGCTLDLVNNGPKKIKFDFSDKEFFFRSFTKVDFEEYLENKPLSMIYNDSFSKYPDYERFVFFDDDTIVPEDFFKVISLGDSCKKYDLKVPRIIEKDTGLTCYPLVNSQVYTGDVPKEIIKDEVFSIGSGLVIYRELVNKFTSFGLDLFDNRFALYGVDFSLFRRLELLKDKGVDFNVLISGALKHSLSSSEESISEWRYRERLIDLILSVKHYPSSQFMFFYMIARIFLRDIIKKRGKNLKLILDVFYKGEHPRCTVFKSGSR